MQHLVHLGRLWRPCGVGAVISCRAKHGAGTCDGSRAQPHAGYSQADPPPCPEPSMSTAAAPPRGQSHPQRLHRCSQCHVGSTWLRVPACARHHRPAMRQRGRDRTEPLGAAPLGCTRMLSHRLPGPQRSPCPQGRLKATNSICAHTEGCNQCTSQPCSPHIPVPTPAPDRGAAGRSAPRGAHGSERRSPAAELQNTYLPAQSRSAFQLPTPGG